MHRFQYANILTISLALLALAAFGCGAASPAARTAGSVAFAVPVYGTVDVEVAITSEDMPSPLLAELTVASGMAVGRVDDVEVGSSRRITITSYDQYGPRCTRETWADVSADREALVALPLRCDEDIDEQTFVDEDDVPPVALAPASPAGS